MIKKSFWFEWYEGSKQKTTKRIRFEWKAVIAIFVIFLVIWSFYNVFGKINPRGFQIFSENFKDFFAFWNVSVKYPGYSLISLSFQFLWTSLKYVALGNTIGFILAMISSYFSARNINKSYVSTLLKSIILFFRAFPVLVFVYAFREGFESILVASLVFSWFTWLWLHKYIYEIIENVDLKKYNHYIMTGYSKFSAYRKGIFPEIKTKLILIYFLSFEANLRWSSILGAAGVEGIGSLFNDAWKDNKYRFKAIGIPLVIFLFAILFLEAINLFLNKVVLYRKNRTFSEKDYGYCFNWKTWFQVFLILIFVVIALIAFSEIRWNFSRINDFGIFLKSVFIPRFDFWFTPVRENNPFFMIGTVIFQSISIVVLTIFFALLISIFLNEKLNSKYVYLPLKIINSVVRVIPTIFWFFIFSPIFHNPLLFVVVIAISIHNSSVLSIQINALINAINFKIYDNLKLQGWSRGRLLIFYVLPSIKKDLISWVVFKFEDIFRNVILFGVFGSSLLGARLVSLLSPGRAQELSIAASYVYPIVIFIILLNIFSAFFKKKSWKKVKDKNSSFKNKLINHSKVISTKLKRKIK
ncbi:PhnE/PtxC family ABC transporter permease [Mycoplasmopsis pulmonis]|uniref:PhnE/PtxC family ABC transporter permease n=1 Tax=Mycoplasmopsis pulmonis TaxID=2107 RepID=UPI002ACDA79F|nr:ABC transporter permease subunit [Mycoplasmopsis pulmonis]MDZ7293181.1 hypothetical protein [Mycoplasmopsis pulmonis]